MFAREIGWSLLVVVATACSRETPPPQRPGDSCSRQIIDVPHPSPHGPLRTLHGCPEGMRCRFQSTAMRNSLLPECELLPGRCLSASDCRETEMECRRSSSQADSVGFCTPSPI